jgi:uncharacterized protein
MTRQLGAPVVLRNRAAVPPAHGQGAAASCQCARARPSSPGLLRCLSLPLIAAIASCGDAALLPSEPSALLSAEASGCAIHTGTAADVAFRVQEAASGVLTATAIDGVSFAIGGCGEVAQLRRPFQPPANRSVEDVSTAVAAIVGTFRAGPLDRPLLLESMGEFEIHFGGADAGHEASLHVRSFFENGGERIWVSRARNATEEELVGSPGSRRGIHALDAANRFNLLLVPELFSSPAIPDAARAGAAAVDYAASRGASILLDPPAETASAQALVTWLNTSGTDLRRRDAALYFGRIRVEESARTGATRWIGISGASAGIYARSDAAGGVWSVPAGTGLPLRGALEVQPLTTAEREALTGAGVNPVVRSPGGAILLWGARTLSPDPEFRYLHVHRLDLHVEALVRDRLAWAKGESSGPELWEQARTEAGAVLHDLWLRGAFQGTRPEDGYFVRSGSDTHTPGDVAESRLNVLIGHAPLRPAEFIVRMITIEL